MVVGSYTPIRTQISVGGILLTRGSPDFFRFEGYYELN
jgi:hypothetical protein